MSTSPITSDDPPRSTALRANAMGVLPIAFLVVAAAAPLAAMTANVPLAIGLGNGAGVPGSFVIAGVTLALFSVGYSTMSRHVTNAGAFYAYVSAGLGRRLGTGAGAVALLGYNLLVVYLVGLLAYYFTATAKSDLGIDLPWPVVGLVLLAAAGVIARFGISLGARLLAVLLLLEMALLVVMDVAIVVQRSPAAFTPQSFTPTTVFSGSPGLSLLFAFLCFIGFEATAIFSEEAKDSVRTVPRATYLAVGVLAVLYTLTAWAGVASVGADHVQSFALSTRGPELFPLAASAALGPWAGHLMSWLVLSSLFATLIALHGMASRYIYSFARDGLLPRRLGSTHRVHQTPTAAGAVQVVFTAIVVLVYAALGADPYASMAATLGGLATLGIVGLQALTAVAIVAFLVRRRGLARRWVVVATALGALSLIGVTALVTANFGLVSGTSGGIASALPWVVVVVFVGGVAAGGRAPVSAVNPATPVAVPDRT